MEKFVQCFFFCKVVELNLPLTNISEMQKYKCNRLTVITVSNFSFNFPIFCVFVVNFYKLSVCCSDLLTRKDLCVLVNVFSVI